MLRRVAPALALYFLSPLVGEFLLGNLSMASLATGLLMAPMYGGGAVLVREIARRTGRGWPTMLLLALAYAVVEEGLITQSLFNPNYAGQDLLSYGHISALGMGSWWTLFVLTLHTVWSIAVPIALIEALVPKRRTEPWVGRIGLSVVTVLFVLDAIVIHLGNRDMSAYGGPKGEFIAAPGQFVGSVVAVAVLALIAFLVPRRTAAPTTGTVPSPLLAGLFGFVVSSAWVGLQYLGDVAPAWAMCLGFLLLYALAIWCVSRWSSRGGWTASHPCALAIGVLFTYAWHGFPQPSLDQQNSTVDLVGNAIFAAGAVLLAIAAWRTSNRQVEERTSSDT